MLVMGLITAALTAAYMIRAIYLTFFGEYRGHGHPHESGPRLTVPLWILSFLAIVAGVVNLPAIFPDEFELRFEFWVEPREAIPYFPKIDHAEFSYALAGISILVALIGIAAASYYYFVKVRAQGSKATELADGPTHRFALARAGYTLLVNKYYLDYLYERVIVGAIKGPIARGVYWFNQNALDRVVNEAGERSVQAGRWIYDNVDQKVIDGTVNGSGIASDASGEELRRMQTGKVQQYAGILFAGATVLALIFMVVI